MIFLRNVLYYKYLSFYWILFTLKSNTLICFEICNEPKLTYLKFPLDMSKFELFAKRIKTKMVRWNIVETNSFLSSLLYLNEFLRSRNTNHFLRYPHYWLYIDSFSAYISYGPMKKVYNTIFKFVLYFQWKWE